MQGGGLAVVRTDLRDLSRLWAESGLLLDLESPEFRQRLVRDFGRQSILVLHDWRAVVIREDLQCLHAPVDLVLSVVQICRQPVHVDSVIRLILVLILILPHRHVIARMELVQVIRLL